MSLTKSEFDLLNYFRETRNITQRDMADKFSMSLGKVNKLVTDLKSKELINNTDTVYDITERGMDALKPYKVNNAIIMAAGMSSRFAPLSYERPKGLLNVKGEILIEREIRQLQEAGITDITIVVGYMKEKFFYLEEKFGAKIVVNEDYTLQLLIGYGKKIANGVRFDYYKCEHLVRGLYGCTSYASQRILKYIQ